MTDAGTATEAGAWEEPVVPGVNVKDYGFSAQSNYTESMHIRCDDMLAILHHFGLTQAALTAARAEVERLAEIIRRQDNTLAEFHKTFDRMFEEGEDGE